MDKERLKAQHTEELRDAEMHEQLSNDNPEWHRVFADIAHDERNHAEMIKHILDHTN